METRKVFAKEQQQEKETSRGSNSNSSGSLYMTLHNSHSLGFREKSGKYLFGGPYKKDWNLLGSILIGVYLVRETTKSLNHSLPGLKIMWCAHVSCKITSPWIHSARIPG